MPPWPSTWAARSQPSAWRWCCWAAARCFLRRYPAERVFAPGLVWTALAAATLPGALRLYGDLREMVEWELECHPELNDVHAFINEHCPPPGTVLLGGGWDQLTNNGVRWYRITRAQGTVPGYDDVPVVGDMIGSLVFPPEPRIRHWAQVLGETGLLALPDRVVLVEPDPETFLYRTRMGPEVAIYRDIPGRARRLPQPRHPRVRDPAVHGGGLRPGPRGRAPADRQCRGHPRPPRHHRGHPGQRVPEDPRRGGMVDAG